MMHGTLFFFFFDYSWVEFCWLLGRRYIVEEESIANKKNRELVRPIVKEKDKHNNGTYLRKIKLILKSI